MDFLLPLLLLLPLAGAVVVALLGSDGPRKALAMLASLATFAASLGLLQNGSALTTGEAVLAFQRPWFPEVGLSLHLAADGISVWLVLLTTFIMPIAIGFSNRFVSDRIGQHLVLLLLMETAMVGVFLAQDLVLFYTFFEFTLIPMYFLIGQWGSENRVYAALKFVMYTLLGSALMLVAIVAIFVQTGTFSIPEIAATLPATAGSTFQVLGFLAFALAFAVKIPLFPFHTWLPDAHVQAPTAGSIILAGVLLKMGTYGLLRLAMPFFPEAFASYASLLIVLSLIGIVYGALVALKQQDVKSLVAYSSISHMGFIVLGLAVANTQAVSGAVLQMVNHGLSTGALFLMVGLLYERRHTRLFSDFGGLWKSVPVYCGLLLITALSSVGLPGLNGFVGEFTILLGTWQVSPAAAAVASTGVILAAWYLLTAFRKLAQGEIRHQENQVGVLPDLQRSELMMIVPLVVMFFVIGLYPNLLLDHIVPAVEILLP